MLEIKGLFLRLLVIGFLLINSALAQQKVAPIDITITDKNISLINKSEYAVSSKEIKTIAKLQKTTWKTLDSGVSKTNQVTENILQYWVRFSTNNSFTADTSLILYLTEKNHKVNCLRL